MDIRLQKNDTLGYQYFPDNSLSHYDTISTIYIDNTILAPTLMETIPSYSVCGNNVYKYSSDIGLKMTGVTWHYGINDTKPSNKFDFYSDILHELGHALCLNHIINPNATTTITNELELLYPSETGTLTKAPTERSYLGSGRQMDKKGTLNVRDSSKVINWACSSLTKVREFTSPINTTVCPNTQASFIVYAQQLAGSPLPTYQWQFYTGTGSWQNVSALSAAPYSLIITGQTAATFNIRLAKSSINKFYFRCIVGNIDGCSITSKIAKINVLPAPIITTQPVSATFKIAKNIPPINFTVNNTSGFTYQWFVLVGLNNQQLNNGGAYSGTNTNTLTIQPGQLGLTTGQSNTYLCIVTDPSTGCTTQSSSATLSLIANGSRMALSNNNTKTDIVFNYYPNPANDKLRVTTNSKNNSKTTISVISSIGVTFIEKSFTTNNVEIETKNLPNGLYLLKLTNGNTTTTKEILITH